MRYPSCDGTLNAMENASARAMWEAFVAAYQQNESNRTASRPTSQRVPLPAPDPGAYPDAWAFGYGAEVETQLAELVVNGTKRATASSHAVVLAEGEALPTVGKYSVVLDGTGTARCIIQTTHIAIDSLESVTDEFAWIEGEGDRSRDYWLSVHREFFSREHAEMNLPFDDSIAVVYEQFVVVWPLEIADTATT